MVLDWVSYCYKLITSGVPTITWKSHKFPVSQCQTLWGRFSKKILSHLILNHHSLFQSYITNNSINSWKNFASHWNNCVKLISHLIFFSCRSIPRKIKMMLCQTWWVWFVDTSMAQNQKHVTVRIKCIKQF